MLWFGCTLCGVLWGVVRRSFAVGVLVTPAAFRASCGLSVRLWAWRCAAALPSYLKRIFDRFFQGIRDRTPPGRGRVVRLQALHQLTAEPTPPAAHRRHSIHQQGHHRPEQRRATNTGKIQLLLLHIFKRIFQIFPDWYYFARLDTVRHCCAVPLKR